jgi:hypothetical protein
LTEIHDLILKNISLYEKNVIQTIAKYEYVEIFPTDIPQCLRRRHWGFLAFLTYDITKVVPTKVHLVSHMYLIQRFVSHMYLIQRFVSHMYLIQRFVSHRLYLLAK